MRNMLFCFSNDDETKTLASQRQAFSAILYLKFTHNDPPLKAKSYDEHDGGESYYT